MQSLQEPGEEPSGAPSEPGEEPAARHAGPARAATDTPLPEAVPAPPHSEQTSEQAAKPTTRTGPTPHGGSGSDTEAVTGTGAHAVTGADAAADDATTATETAPTRHPRGRTSGLMASAALLGIVAGVATGYTVQADREPTPLPPLSQARLSYPDAYVPEDAWEPVPAEYDRRVKTDGDLRELLVDKPEGAREPLIDGSPEGWVPLSAYAGEYESSGYMFGNFAEWDIRRVAGVEWESGQYRTTTVRLVQYHDLVRRSATQHVRDQQLYMSGDE